MTRERDRIQENANKYIVKNCPCYMNQPEADCWADQLSWCENCTDLHYDNTKAKEGLSKINEVLQ